MFAYLAHGGRLLTYDCEDSVRQVVDRPVRLFVTVALPEGNYNTTSLHHSTVACKD